MGRKLVQVHLILFWTRPNTKSFHQVSKGFNVSAKAFDDSGSIIPGRSIHFPEYYGRDTRSTGLILIFLLQHLGFVTNFKKCALELTQKIEFLGIIVNSKTMTLFLTQEKV